MIVHRTQAYAPGQPVYAYRDGVGYRPGVVESIGREYVHVKVTHKSMPGKWQVRKFAPEALQARQSGKMAQA